ncbi:MAG: hypothetical protein DRN04_09910 [Thermoprotei archaeon]|nr:MAG: hypothetical protein DRN04_09910 [Thermoprotei archaeon]
MKVDLSVEIAGIVLENPLIVASGTPTRTAEHIIKCYEAGAAGAVTKTITYAEIHRAQPKPRMHVIYPLNAIKGGYFSFYSIELMSEIEPEKWVNEIKKVKEKYPDRLLVASIAGRSLEEWEKLARLVDEAGADAIELNLSCPHVEKEEFMGKAAAKKTDIIYNIVKTVKKAASIPVIGKLTPQGANPLELAKTMHSARVDAVVSTARFQGLVLDLNSLEPILWKSFGGYGGPWQVPISLAWTAHIALELPDLTVIGSGGIHSGKDAAAFIAVGASAFQVCTAVIVKSYSIIKQILKELADWMTEKGYMKIEDFKGKALPKIKSLEELNRKKIYRIEVDENKCSGCGICAERCFYGAIIVKKGKPEINYNLCDNCGLCVAICPNRALKIKKAH